MTNAGRWAMALMRATHCSSVEITSLLAALSKPTWLSLICTKLRPRVAFAVAVPAIVRELKPQPVSVHTTPVPAHAMHFKKPLRSMPSDSCSWSI